MTEAVVLSDRLAEIETVLSQQAQSPTARPTEQAAETQSTPITNLTDSGAVPTTKNDEADGSGDEGDLTARKSRLSG
jgi:hypothetical protein